MGGGEAMTDAAVDEVERDGTPLRRQLVKKETTINHWCGNAGGDSHLYAGRCNNFYIL